MTTEERRGETTTTATDASGAILDEFIKKARLAATSDQLPAARAFTGELASRLDAWVEKQAGKQDTVPARPKAALNALLAEIDKRLADQVNEVIHDPDFQKLESSWRGLEYLVSKTPPSDQIKIKVLDVTKEELCNDLIGTNVDLSTTFDKVYENNFGTYGGKPTGLIVGDFEFGPDTRDVALLTSLSKVAAAAHAPFIAAAGANMFGWNDFTELEGKGALSPIFDTDANPQYMKWKSFRESEDSRYVGLCLPQMLLREPYTPESSGGAPFAFQEDVGGEGDLKKFLWGNPAYALATRMTEAFSDHGWCVRIRGPMGGGLVEGLPTHTFRTDRGDIAATCPTKVAITERKSRELSELGFIPLEHCQGTDKAAFFSTPTCQLPKKWNTDEANANSALSARLQYIMATARFAHYLKVMMRDYVGDFMSRDRCEDHLNQWIAQYVTHDPDPSSDQLAKRPLKDARIEVTDDPARPGAYRAVAYLRPHFQLEALTVSLRLVAELPQTTAR